MFSVQQKRDISDAVQKILRATNHPELPDGEIKFLLHVEGAESWSWASIKNNGAITAPTINPWNEMQDKKKEKENTNLCPECGASLIQSVFDNILSCTRCRYWRTGSS